MKKIAAVTVSLMLTLNSFCPPAGFQRKEVLAETQISASKNVDFYNSEKLVKMLNQIPPNLLPEEKARLLYKIFAVKNNGLKLSDSNKNRRPPRKIDETLVNGGDCSDFSFILAAAARLVNLSGGAYFVKVHNAPEDMKHIVVYVIAGSKRIIIDPQAKNVNEVLDNSNYSILAEFSFEQLPYLFYREYGDYYRRIKNTDKAISSYLKSLAFYDKDPYVLYVLTDLYYKNDDLTAANTYADKYLNLKDYSILSKNARTSADKVVLRVKVEYLVAVGIEECNKGNSNGGKALLNDAKKLGETNNVIDNKDKEIIENNIKNCGKSQ